MEEYKIVPYSPEFLDSTVELLKGMWSSRTSDNRMEYFRWKYHDNPYTDRPLSIITLYRKKVVGFRGYLATPWQAQGEEFLALLVGDTLVGQRHRRKGLSMKMGMLACEEYAHNHKFLLNMEANVMATGGYLKLGFLPLLDKRTQTSFAKMDKTGIENVVVSNEPDLQRMQSPATNKITLKTSDEFFNWRYKSTIPHNFLFYYYKQDYAVIGQVPNNDVAFILDYTENDIGSFETILRRIRHTPSITTLSIRTINLSESVSNVLKKLRFRDNNPKNKEMCPILIRPAKPNHVEDDWFLSGLDMRDINNWKLKGIYSEWA